MSDCVEWLGYRNRKGYGMQWVSPRYRYRLAHRVAYCKANGLVLEDIAGMVVRHACDNPGCVNPEHLLLGTIADNNRDRDERGRTATGDRARRRGEKNGQSKLTDSQVKEILALYSPGCRVNGGQALARRYGVAQQLISGIVNGKRWTHIRRPT